MLPSPRPLAVQREPFSSTESLVARLHAAVPISAIVDHELLADYDRITTRASGRAPLPVLRVRFATRPHLGVRHPRMSQIVAVVHRWSRLERWPTTAAQPRLRLLVRKAGRSGRRYDRALPGALRVERPSAFGSA